MNSVKRQSTRQMILVSSVLATSTLFGLTSSVAAAGQIESRTVNPSPFDSIILDAPATFTVQVGAETKVTLSAEPKVLKALKVSSKNGQLTISTKGSFNTQEAINVNITTPSLNALTAHGVSDVSVGALKTDVLRVIADGSSSIEMEKLNLKQLIAHIQESSDFRTGGKAKSQKIEINGSASYEGEQLKSASAALTVAGSGSAEVHATKSLDVKISDAGSVTYGGQPSITKSVKDAGSLDSQ